MEKHKTKNTTKSVFKDPNGLTKKTFTLSWAKMINTIEKNKFI